MDTTDTTINYQALAVDIVLAAMQDAQGDGSDALAAQQWLDVVDLESVGVLPLIDQIDPTTFFADGQS